MAEAVGFYTDTTICIGCKACQVACHQWNDLPAGSGPADDSPAGLSNPKHSFRSSPQTGRVPLPLLSGNSYDNTGSFSDVNWRHVTFIEQFSADRREAAWLMMSDVCKHCVHAPCLEVCPTGAIIRTEFDTVYVQEPACNGCRDCISACPFGVIHVSPTKGVAQKCTFCYDRLQQGLPPACAQACPTQSIRFGPLVQLKKQAQQRVAQLHGQGKIEAHLYGADDKILGGLNSFYLLVDKPEVYGLPSNPKVPSKSVLPATFWSIFTGLLVALGVLFRFRQRTGAAHAAAATPAGGTAMNFYVADPDWGAWIIAYFYLGGIAAGSYFIAILIEWFGSEEDQALTRIAYWIAFPLALLCLVFLTIDLTRPERFWHMMFKSEVTKEAFAEGFPFTAAGWSLAAQAPAFKYWSPISVGSWGLSLFTACAFASFLTAVWPNGWFGWLLSKWPHRVLQFLGAGSGFFVACYTGALLGATNQPMWSDTVWLAPLFLASSASTSLATMSLIARWWGIGSPAAQERLEGAKPFALGLELVVLGAFAASLGDLLLPVLQTWRGNLLIFGSLFVAVLLPLLLHAHVGRRHKWGVPAAAVCALLGGLLLRYSAVTTPSELLARGPATRVSFAPEEGRRAGERGADVGNHGKTVRPRSKLPMEEP